MKMFKENEVCDVRRAWLSITVYAMLNEIATLKFTSGGNKYIFSCAPNSSAHIRYRLQFN